MHSRPYFVDWALEHCIVLWVSNTGYVYGDALKVYVQTTTRVWTLVFNANCNALSTQRLQLALMTACSETVRFTGYYLMYKIAVYTLVNGVITHQKQQIS